MQVAKLQKDNEQQAENVKNLEHASRMKDRGCCSFQGFTHSHYVLECGDQQDEAGFSLLFFLSGTVLFRVFVATPVCSTRLSFILKRLLLSEQDSPY